MQERPRILPRVPSRTGVSPGEGGWSAAAERSVLVVSAGTEPSLRSGVNIVLSLGILPVLPNPLRALSNAVSSTFVMVSAINVVS